MRSTMTTAVVAAAIAHGRSIPRASVAIERAGQRVELGLTLQALRRAPGASGGSVKTGGSGDDGGSGAGGPAFLVLFADVTDLTRRESEERFAAGLAQLGELSAGVAHELRNSLATVQGYLALAARRELPGEARERIACVPGGAGEDEGRTFSGADAGQCFEEQRQVLVRLARADVEQVPRGKRALL